MNAFHTTEATQVTNITLNVEDLNKMTNFYKNILGFSIKEQDDNHVIFNVGANGHTLTLQYLEDGRRPGFRSRFISCRLFTSYTHRFSKLFIPR